MSSSTTYFFRGEGTSHEKPCGEPSANKIPPALIKKLGSNDEREVAEGIREIAGNPLYLQEDVCEILAEIIRKGAEGRTTEEACIGFLGAIGKARPVSAASILGKNLFSPNDVNGRLLSVIISMPLEGAVRKAAIDVLGRYREGDLSPEVVSEIEERLSNAFFGEKDPRMKREIESTFALRGWRPRISTNPPAFAKPVRKTPQPPAVYGIKGGKTPVKV